MSLFDKFKTGLSLSSLSLSAGIKNIFSTKNIDESVLSQFEELLISADVGVESAAELKKEFEKLKIDKNLTDSSQIINILITKVSETLIPYQRDLLSLNSCSPTVIVVSGVNGVGKTTTLKSIMQLVKNSNGEVLFDGINLKKIEPHMIQRLGIGYVPQGRGIFPTLTVKENLEISLRKNDKENIDIDTYDDLKIAKKFA